MEVEEYCSSIVATQMSNAVSVVVYMLKKGFSRSKLKKIFDFHTRLKQQNHPTNSITSSMLHHHYAASSICRSTDVAMSYVSPLKDYEFSCSNTPLVRRRKRYYQSRHHQKVGVFVDDIKFSEYESVEASPAFSLSDFGRSPVTVRQLRVTDSPFSMKDADENTDQLDKAAEEFIKKFYMELEKQKRMAPPITYYI